MRYDRRFFVATAVLSLMTVVGCSPGKTKVVGKVTYTGKPVTWGNVTLVASDGMAFYGELNSQGEFTVDGVPTGPIKIGVTSSKPTVAEPTQAGGLKNDTGMSRGDRGKKATAEQAKAWFAIPDKYSDPNSSGLTDTAGKTPLTIDLK